MLKRTRSGRELHRRRSAIFGDDDLARSRGESGREAREEPRQRRGPRMSGDYDRGFQGPARAGTRLGLPAPASALRTQPPRVLHPRPLSRFRYYSGPFRAVSPGLGTSERGMYFPPRRITTLVYLRPHSFSTGLIKMIQLILLARCSFSELLWLSHGHGGDLKWFARETCGW